MKTVSLNDSLFYIDTSFRFLGALPFPVRMTVIRLKEGKLWLHSPIKTTNEVRQALLEWGQPTYLIAPNLFHHLFLNEMKAAFPDAKVFSAKGLKEKQPQLHIDAILDQEAPWQNEIAQINLGGQPKVNETVFFHFASKTLILTDLIFHFDRFPNLFSKLLWMSNLIVENKVGVSRMYRSMIKDKKQFKESLEKIFEWDFEHLIMCHGKIITGDAKEKLKEAFSWL